MPLLDHFHPPIENRCPWESLHSSWATYLANALNRHWLKDPFIAFEMTHAGSSTEIDVATMERATGLQSRQNNGLETAVLEPEVWAPPTALWTARSVKPKSFSIHIFSRESALTLIAAIELISPANKDRKRTRRAFATKCANFLYQGISLIIIDVVTDRKGNLHNEIMKIMSLPTEFILSNDDPLYVVAYRPVKRGKRDEIDIWPKKLSLGSDLPTMPLALPYNHFVPVEFEAAYQESCRSKRLI